ncbi:hypothetical protein FNAPI_9699 [Fusarium napiforme]|uniref:Uncharacterized protein n=1 Tax=Fusarium napiforme TaxID=42672 RepID=A0A8H5IUZ9_9HYPO|nr:hypothetical protein FNAPI_9699 [Fusarium napiforme]
MSIQPPSQVFIMSDHIDPIGNALAGFFVNFHDRSDSPPGQPTAQFGHIETPPYRLKPSIRKRIQDVFSAEKHILFVVPDIQREASVGYSSNGYTTVEIMTYRRPFGRLRSNSNLNANQSDPTMWLNCPDPERWYMDDRLPPKIVIIFHIDPNVPAVCSLSLAGIVEWSPAQSTLPGYIIRVVTLSAEEDCDLLKKLFDTSGLQYHFTDLDLAQNGELDPMGSCTVVNSKHMEAQVSNILSRVRVEPDKSRLILCFDIAFCGALNAKHGPEDDQFVLMGKLSVASSYRDFSLLTYRSRLQRKETFKRVKT